MLWIKNIIFFKLYFYIDFFLRKEEMFVCVDTRRLAKPIARRDLEIWYQLDEDRSKCTWL